MNQADIIEAFRNDPVKAQEAQEQVQAILTRSATDMEFRRLLLSDSRAALSQHFGREVPEGMNIAFIENKADATVVLPDVADATAELSEVELETVAGGTAPVAVAAVLVAAYIYYNSLPETN